jgi:RNase H-fold protein (predicted Holliday junction resolvase)
MKQKLDRASGELDSRAASLFLQEFLDQNLSLTYLPDDLEEGD